MAAPDLIERELRRMLLTLERAIEVVEPLYSADKETRSQRIQEPQERRRDS